MKFMYSVVVEKDQMTEYKTPAMEVQLHLSITAAPRQHRDHLEEGHPRTAMMIVDELMKVSVLDLEVETVLLVEDVDMGGAGVITPRLMTTEVGLWTHEEEHHLQARGLPSKIGTEDLHEAEMHFREEVRRNSLFMLYFKFLFLTRILSVYPLFACMSSRLPHFSIFLNFPFIYFNFLDIISN
jgi:hypothetical protein